MNNYSAKDFYASLADFYDQMTDLESRLQRWENIFRQFLKKYPAKSALDIGCGTGIHLLVLNRLGLHTMGIDLSLPMLKKAASHIKNLGQTGSLINASMLHLPLKETMKVDLILCTGNTLPHITNPELISKMFRNWLNFLNPTGKVVLQFLNYHRILMEKKRLIHARHSEEKSILRFYDFHEELLGFNIVEIQKNNTVSWHQTQLYPYTRKMIENQLRESGFSEISVYASLNFDSFDENYSNDVVVVAGP